MLLEVTDPAVDDGTGGAGILDTVTHEGPIEGINDPWGHRDE